ncbi:hypothetical protein [Xanthomonas campestris]|uniref:hypothetical protein n=1 Tax=Xanthomonas campestris TaxID=339 RepID=UPI0039C24C27
MPAKVVIAAMLPINVMMDHDRLEVGLFESSDDGEEHLDRTISIWRMVVVFDELISYLGRYARIRCDALN